MLRLYVPSLVQIARGVTVCVAVNLAARAVTYATLTAARYGEPIDSLGEDED